MNSNFSNNRVARERREERKTADREALAKYLYDISKLYIGGLVIAILLQMRGEDYRFGFSDFAILLLGLTTAFIFAFQANRLMKRV